MGERHLGQDLFRALIEGDADKDRLIQRLQEHLLEVCPDCRAEFEAYRASRFRNTHGPAVQKVDPMPAPEPCAWEVGSLVEELTALPADRRAAFLAEQLIPGEFLPELVTALCEIARHAEPEGALEWARLAENFLLEEGSFPAHGASLARSLAFQGNALYRLVQDREALAAMDRAWQVLREMHVEDDAVTAEISSLTASLYVALERYDEALALLDHAECLFASLHRTQDRARVLVQLGIVHDFLGDPDLAYEVTYRAIHLFRPWENPKLYVQGFINLARYLCSQGKFEDALEVAMVDGAMVEEMDITVQANYQWLLARIHEGLGDDRVAERHYRRAREGFLELGNGYDIAILCLHLASLCYRNYRRGEALELATQALHLARSYGLHPEAQAALTLLSQTLRSGATAGLILAEVPRFLQTIRENPEAKFHPPQE